MDLSSREYDNFKNRIRPLVIRVKSMRLENFETKIPRPKVNNDVVPKYTKGTK